LERYKTDLVELQYTLIVAEARYWELTKVKGNELRKYLNLLELALEHKGRHEIGLSLAQIKRLFQEGAEILWMEVPELNAALAKVPMEYASEVEAIRPVVKAASP
jgi:hypothetical protein